MNRLTALPGRAGKSMALILAPAVMAAALATALIVRAQEEPWRAAVASLTARPGDDAGELDISWNAHPESPTSYRLVWAPDGEDFPTIDDTGQNAYPTGNSHTVTGLDADSTYRVKVRAKWSTGEKSGWSAVVTGDSAPEDERSAAVRPRRHHRR